MPRTDRSAAAAKIVNDSSSSATRLVEELAEPLAEYMLTDYSDEDWRNSPVIEALAHVAAWHEQLATIRRADKKEAPLGGAEPRCPETWRSSQVMNH